MNVLRWILVRLLRFYQVAISPLLGPQCRFYPSCSNYAIEAIELHGSVRGSFLAIRRLLKCHPGNPGGVDAVPRPETEEFTCSDCAQVQSD